jgi:hypothetical protein
VKHDRIVFHDPDDHNPDWQVRQCYTLLIAAASEIENGVENLWKRGPADGRLITKTLEDMFLKTCSKLSRRRLTSVGATAITGTRTRGT